MPENLRVSIVRISALAAAVACWAGCRPAPESRQSVPQWTLVQQGIIESNEAAGGVAFSHIIALSARGDRLYMTQWMDASVVVLSQDGTPIGRIGRAGGGPGEFGGPGTLAWRSDTLVVLDGQGGRISLFTSGGHFIRSVPVRLPLPRDLAVPIPLILAPGGRVIAEAEPYPDDVVRGLVSRAPVLRFSPNSDYSPASHLDTLAWRDMRHQSAEFLLPNGNHTWTAQPLGDFSFLAVAPDGSRLAMVDRQVDSIPNGYVVTSLSSEGDTLWRRKYKVRPRRPSRAAIDSIIRLQATRLSSGPALTLGHAEQIVKKALFIPDPLPAATFAIFAHNHGLWIRGSDDLAERNVTWAVLDSSGTVLATLSMPEAVRVLDIDGSEVWGTEDDSLGVPRIIRYAIRRGGRR
jgi:hypothetical protein